MCCSLQIFNKTDSTSVVESVRKTTGASQETYKGFFFWLQLCKHIFLLVHCCSVARKIAIKKGLVDIKTTERETASFEVELSHPNVPGTWVRNGIQLKPTNHFRMSAKGQVHSLTIYNLSVEDTGTFVFCVENLKTSARLVVKGK